MGPDNRFFLTHDPISVVDALASVGAPRDGAEGPLSFVSTIENATSDAIVYAETKSAAESLEAAMFGLCLTTTEFAAAYQGSGLVASCESPRAAFAELAARLHSPRVIEGDGVHPSAKIGANVRLHSTVTVAENAVVGDGAVLESHVVVGPGVEIGAGASISAGTIITCALIGEGFVSKPGAKLGQAGFGFAPTPTGVIAVPQLGRLIIGDNVEIGANTTVDRGALGDTKIGAGTKIDNLVQIGHNVQIGRHCVIAAQVGFAGSTVLEDGVMIGGQAGLADHLKVGAGAKIAAKAGVMSNIPAGATWGGFPARPMRRWLKETAMIARLAKKKS